MSQDLIGQLSPLITTLVLAGTLIFQIIQFRQTQKDKEEEAEDTRWTDAVKLLSQSDNIPPAGLLLKRFAGSQRYAQQAFRTAVQILIKTQDPEAFTKLFISIFDPIDQKNVPAVFDLNRSLTSNFNPLQEKVWNPATNKSDLGKLSPTDRHQYESLEKELDFISIKLASTLKGARAVGVGLDLHYMTLWNADLRSADLSRANLNGTNLSAADIRRANLSGANLNAADLYAVDIKGANLSEITEYQDATFLATAWWQASQISQPLLQYLIAIYPFDPNVSYAGHYSTSKSEYDAGKARLQQPPSER